MLSHHVKRNNSNELSSTLIAEKILCKTFPRAQIQQIQSTPKCSEFFINNRSCVVGYALRFG